jgi:hypothetical protein
VSAGAVLSSIPALVAFPLATFLVSPAGLILTGLVGALATVHTLSRAPA